MAQKNIPQQSTQARTPQFVYAHYNSCTYMHACLHTLTHGKCVCVCTHMHACLYVALPHHHHHRTLPHHHHRALRSSTQGSVALRRAHQSVCVHYVCDLVRVCMCVYSCVSQRAATYTSLSALYRVKNL